MKRVTASEARRHWFTLLDEVAEGEIVALVRNGRRIIIRREETAKAPKATDYSGIISIPAASKADDWCWDWDAGDGVKPGKQRK